MKTALLMSAAALCVLLSEAATAQFVKGNEAVTTLPDGRRRVETPPLPKGTMPAPCPAATPACAGSGWRMVETNDGLQDCTEIYARPTTCKPSTFGKEPRSRLWIVKFNGRWMQCQHPDIKSRCVSTTSLPYSAVQ